MEMKIKQCNEMPDATIEMIDGVMVVSPKEVKFVPKDGDILFIESLYDNIIIYKESDCGICRYVNFSDNQHLYTDNNTVCNKDDVKVIRPATEEEKNKLFDKLKEEGYEWKPDTKELVKLKWKPKINETCFIPCFDFPEFIAKQWLWEINGFSTYHYNEGWVFKTKEECQAFCERLNNALNQVKP